MATAAKQKPAPKPAFGDGLRATWGRWRGTGELVRELVASGWGVSEAVRQVAAAIGVPESYCFHGIRGDYYTRARGVKGLLGGDSNQPKR